MFSSAYAIAREFTFPVVISRRDLKGKCSSGIGVFVVINKEGWISTAGHNFVHWDSINASLVRFRVRGWEGEDSCDLAESYALLDDRERPYYEHRLAAL